MKIAVVVTVAKLDVGGKNENRVISWKAMLGSRPDVMMS